MKAACGILSFLFAIGGLAVAYYVGGWKPVAVYLASGVLVVFFDNLSKRLPR